jgi:hypothetical protein
MPAFEPAELAPPLATPWALGGAVRSRLCAGAAFFETPGRAAFEPPAEIPAFEPERVSLDPSASEVAFAAFGAMIT